MRMNVWSLAHALKHTASYFMSSMRKTSDQSLWKQNNTSFFPWCCLEEIMKWFSGLWCEILDLLKVKAYLLLTLIEPTFYLWRAEKELDYLRGGRSQALSLPSRCPPHVLNVSVGLCWLLRKQCGSGILTSNEG